MRVLTEIDRDAIARLRASREFFWLDLTGPTAQEVEHLRGQLGVEPPPAHEPRTRPQLYAHHGTYVVLVYKGAGFVADASEPFGDRVEPFEVVVYVSGDYVATYHEHAVEELERLRQRFAQRAGHHEQLAVARVLDAITDSFVAVLTVLDDRILALEDQVIERPRGRQLSNVARLQRELLGLRRAIDPQRDLLQRAGDEIADLPGLERADTDYLREVADYLVRISEQVDHYFELLTSATNIFTSRVSERLTIVATIFLPLTFVTGFFGQNFGWMVDHVGSLWAFVGWGLGSLLVAVGGMLVWFRRGGYL